MGKVSKRKKQQPPKEALPRNMNEQHRPYLEALRSITEVAALLQKMGNLLPMEFRFTAETRLLFDQLERFAIALGTVAQEPLNAASMAAFPSLGIQLIGKLRQTPKPTLFSRSRSSPFG